MRGIGVQRTIVVDTQGRYCFMARTTTSNEKVTATETTAANDTHGTGAVTTGRRVILCGDGRC